MNPTIFAEVAPPHHWLEYASWIANILLAFAAFIALFQVKAALGQAESALNQNKLSREQMEIYRQDIKLRSKREALNLSMEQCSHFGTVIIPASTALEIELQSKGYKPPQNVDMELGFYSAPDPSWGPIWQDQAMRSKIINFLNKMESYAMYFTNDLADEEVAFIPTGQTICHYCEHYAPFIGVFRKKDTVKYYQHLTKLYGIWKPRVDKLRLEEQGKAIEEAKSKIPNTTPRRPLGTDFIG